MPYTSIQGYRAVFRKNLKVINTTTDVTALWPSGCATGKNCISDNLERDFAISETLYFGLNFVKWIKITSSLKTKTFIKWNTISVTLSNKSIFDWCDTIHSFLHVHVIQYGGWFSDFDLIYMKDLKQWSQYFPTRNIFTATFYRRYKDKPASRISGFIFRAQRGHPFLQKMIEKIKVSQFYFVNVVIFCINHCRRHVMNQGPGYCLVHLWSLRGSKNFVVVQVLTMGTRLVKVIWKRTTETRNSLRHGKEKYFFTCIHEGPKLT